MQELSGKQALLRGKRMEVNNYGRRSTTPGRS